MESPLNRTSVLYITRNGMLEPLGQSQVFSYLKGLSTDYRVTLISFEKPEDLADSGAMERVYRDCESYGIRWLPQRFHYKPALVAPAWSMLVFFYLCLREVRRGNASLIHARSYIPAAVALAVNYFKGTPFIFDMRALWPEELITAKRIRRDSFMHKALAWVERKCLWKASGVVSLTHAAVDYLRREYPEELSQQHIVVIPTCADLERFVPMDTPINSSRVYGCLGTVLSGWFLVDWLATFFRTVQATEPHARFEVVTRDDPAEVRRAIGGGEALQAKLSVFPVPSYLAHEAVQRHDVSVMFFTEGLSKLGSSPTRMGEILGSGLPVIANDGVGDVGRIIQEYRVGVLVDKGSQQAMENALKDINTLMQDPGLASRCRAAAEAVFSLSNGTDAYRRLYRHVLLPNSEGTN